MKEELEGDRIRIETPEHVVFEYELAGFVSRIMAGLLDLILLGFILFCLLIVVVVIVGGPEGLKPWGLALATVAGFIILWGYPILFEIFWKGQTPGKRMLGMRVIQEGGYSLTPQVVIVRNLARVVDFLPGGYFLGLIVMMVNRRYKRVGDFVAGTIVIRERSSASVPPQFRASVAIPVGEEERVAELRRLGVHQLDPALLQVVRDFLSRRASLNPDARVRVADRLCRTITQVLGIPEERGEKLLHCVLAAQSQGEPKEPGASPPAGPLP